ncbi:MAG: transposase [Streptosporangiaceae bacterium]
MAEARRKFDQDFKEGAVRLVLETGKSIAQVARELGIHDGTLGNWVYADRRRRRLPAVITLWAGGGTRPPGGAVTSSPATRVRTRRRASGRGAARMRCSCGRAGGRAPAHRRAQLTVPQRDASALIRACGDGEGADRHAECLRPAGVDGIAGADGPWTAWPGAASLPGHSRTAGRAGVMIGVRGMTLAAVVAALAGCGARLPGAAGRAHRARRRLVPGGGCPAHVPVCRAAWPVL